MKKQIIYIHGKGGNAKEAEHYEPLFEGWDVIGFDYSSKYPWEAVEEFPAFFDRHFADSNSVTVIANSIGAFSPCHPSVTDVSRKHFSSPP